MSVFETAISLLAPPDCLVCGAEGSAVCAGCSAKVIKAFGERCWRCNRLSDNSKTCASCRHAGGPSHVWIGTVYGGAAQALVRLYKFGHLRAASEPIALTMAKTFRGANDYLIVPVPTATSRVRQRGFGHSELLAKMIAYKLKMPRGRVLRRLGQSRQLGSARRDRLEQMEGQFAVKLPAFVKGRRILLIDDVLTTGGTLIAATQTLRAAGAAQVDALVFAKRL